MNVLGARAPQYCNVRFIGFLGLGFAKAFAFLDLAIDRSRPLVRGPSLSAIALASMEPQLLPLCTLFVTKSFNGEKTHPFVNLGTRE